MNLSMSAMSSQLGDWISSGMNIAQMRDSVADLVSALRRPLQERDRSVLTAAGGGKIRTDDIVMGIKPVAMRRRVCAVTCRYRRRVPGRSSPARVHRAAAGRDRAARHDR